MIGLAILGLAFVFFIVVAVFAAKRWHVGHIVAFVFLFLGTLCFLFLLATLLRTHEKFRPIYQKSMAELETELNRARVLEFGDSAEPASEGSLVGIQTLVRSEQLHRGRIWRNVRRVPGPGIRLSMEHWRNDGCAIVGGEAGDEIPEPEPEPEPDAELDGEEAVEAAAGPTNPHGVTTNQFVHAFKEIPIKVLSAAEKEIFFGKLSEEGEPNFADSDERGTCRVPLAYLGKFRVVEATDQSLSLVPEEQLDAAQQRLIADRAEWVLYERLPLDSHQIFDGIEPEQLATMMPLERLNQLGAALSPPGHQAMLREYLRDGKPAEPSDRPDRVAVTVEFTAEHEVIVDLLVDGELPPADQPYTAGGRAQVRSLMQNEPTKFTPGQTATFDSATAQRLISQNIAKQVSATYQRPLRDYEFTFKDSQTRIRKLRNEINTSQDEIESLRQATARLRGQIDKYQEEERLLNADMDGFRTEQDALGSYLDQLQVRLDFLRREIGRLVASPRQAARGANLALAE